MRPGNIPLSRSTPTTVLCLVLCLALSGCCGSGRYVPAPGEEVPAQLEFYDSLTFDRKLSRAMGVAHPEVTVTFPAAITLNDIPERIDKWFAAVEESGGRVQAAPEADDERGILEEMFTFFVRLYEHVAGVCVYAPAKGYDALILYEKPTGIITRVLFLRRAEPDAESQPGDTP